MKARHQDTPHGNQRMLIAVAVVFAFTGGAAPLWAKSGSAGGNVFAALPHIGARPLAPGGLHVGDIAGDPFGYTDTMTLRAVVARVNSNDPLRLIVIDSREAKVCKSTGCAKFFLPVALATEPVPRKWDEVDLRGNVIWGATGRALANDPDLLLLDEPTGNLDPAAAAVLELLAELHKQGRTLVMVTNDPDVADRAGRMVRIKDGRVFSRAERVSIHA